ncbi:MAG TPA: glycosyltransferase family 39 protein, partial [Ktedonobacterales bacterium]|nr:glycosyltransferase family 39 protein [Ktedonobacterales bacterium]
ARSRTRLAAVLHRWQWTRRWEVWAILVIGSILRLWRLDVMNFYTDSANLMSLARQSLLHHEIPITGIYSSIGMLNPPIAVYLLMPFAAVTTNPLLPTIAIALWSILGILLCYIFAARYFGRVAAAVGTLLFALNPWTVSYSRFIWQQNFLPTLVILWALTLYGGCVRGDRRWFVPNAALLALAILLHTSAIFLAPVTLVAVLLAPHRPRLREYVTVAVIVVVLLAPTLLFEEFSQGFDIHVLAQFFTTHGRFNLDVIAMARNAIEGPDANALGTGTPYFRFDTAYSKVTKIALVLLIAGLLSVTLRVVAPAVRILRHGGNETALYAGNGRYGRLRGGLLALWHGLRAQPQWRTYLLLWCWIAIPVLGMLHHSNNLHVHYLMVLYPAIFLMSGIAVRDALTWAPEQWRRLTQGRLPQLALAGRLIPIVAILLLAGVVAGYLLRTGLYLGTLATGQFPVNSLYALPLTQAQALDSQLSALQRQDGASRVYLYLPANAFSRDSLQYLLASEHPDRVSFPETCLLLPAPSEGSVLFVPLAPNPLAQEFLARLPSARVVANLPDGGAKPQPVYQIQGAAPRLSDEQAVAPTIFQDGAGNVLRLEGDALAGPYMLGLRWTILGVANDHGNRPWYEFNLRSAGPSRDGLPPFSDTTCDLTNARAGETLITFLPLVPSIPSYLNITPNEVQFTGPVTLQVHAGALVPEAPSLGPVRFLTARIPVVPDNLLAPMPASADRPSSAPSLPGTILPGDRFSLPTAALTP